MDKSQEQKSNSTSTNGTTNVIPKELQDSVYHKSVDKIEGAAEVRGYDFNKGLDYE